MIRLKKNSAIRSVIAMIFKKGDVCIYKPLTTKHGLEQPERECVIHIVYPQFQQYVVIVKHPHGIMKKKYVSEKALRLKSP